MRRDGAFGKNGPDVTTATVRAARTYTGRERIAVSGYHGWCGRHIGATTCDKGVPKTIKFCTINSL